MFKYFSGFIICLITSGCFSQRNFIPFNDSHISYEGRIAYAADAAALTWPGTSVSVNFTGTQISGQFKDSDTANYYNVIVDGQVISKLHFDTAKKTVVLAAGLSPGNHTLQLYKRTEWDKGTTFFFGFELSSPGKLLEKSPLPGRKMEFFGNSITCGYAIEDTVGDSPVGYFENSYDAYAAITARHFGAQCHSTSKSGIGITISWFPLLAKELYDRLNPTDPNSKWDFSQYTPNLVVINLLQNDFWLVNMPNHEQFKYRFGDVAPTPEFIIAAYQHFVQSVRGKYPEATIICMLGNMDITRNNSAWPGYVQKAIEPLKDKKILSFFVPYKNTPGHPKTGEQQILANELIGFIERNVKW